MKVLVKEYITVMFSVGKVVYNNNFGDIFSKIFFPLIVDRIMVNN